MNERIRNLLIQAQDLARIEVENDPSIKPPYLIPATSVHKGLGLSYEKFAELIVEECVGLCETAAYAPRPALNPTPVEQYAFIIGEGNMAVNLAKQIRKHFGVEE